MATARLPIHCAAAALMAACAVPPSRSWPRPGPTRIADPSARIAFAGFSILPPDGGDWATAPPLPEDPGPIHRAAVFGKMSTRGQDRTVFAAVLILDLGGQRFDGPDAFLAFERSHAEGFLGAQVTPRHRLLDSKLALDGSLPATCVRYGLSVEDTGVPSAPGTPFILDMQGVRCLHPKWPRALVDVGYSERYPRGQQALDVTAEVAPFLRGLAFTGDRPTLVNTISVGSGPQGLVGGAGSIWAAYGDDGVARIDPATNQVVARIRAGRDPVGIAFAAGSVWVANRQDGTVSRIDPVTNQVAATVRTGGAPLTLAAGAGAIWVTDFAGGQVLRIDPATGQVTARIDVGPEANSVVASPDAVWVSLYHAAKLV